MTERTVTVEVTEGEYIAPRGTREVTWLVRLNDDWVHVSAWPAVEIERCQARPGTVWENLTRLTVRPGTELRRVESRPAPPAHRDALDYLKRAPTAPARRVHRQEFRANSRGELVRKP